MKSIRIKVMEIHYTLPYLQFSRLIFAALTGRSLSFRRDAIACVNQLEPCLEVQGTEYLPAQGGYIILVNHYYRPGFPAWWIALAISSIVPREIHWIMAAAWTYPGKTYGKLLENISRFLFRKISGVYNFTNMPPMPPRPFEVVERAQAVRKVMRIVRDNPSTILGLAPEGGDHPDGKMQLPPPGAGRFINHLQASGMTLIPAGIYETDRLCLRFGAPFHLELPNNISGEEIDGGLRRQVYTAIAVLLPKNIISDQLLS